MATAQPNQRPQQQRPDPNEKIISAWGNLETPYDQESEEGVIGAVLIGNNPTYQQVASVIDKADDFFILRLRYVWEAFESIIAQGLDIDYLTTVAELKNSGRLAEIGGPVYLTQLSNTYGTHLHAMSYAYNVRLFAIRRRGMAMADEIKATCLDKTVGIHISMAKLAADFNQWLSELPNTTTAEAGDVANELLHDLHNPLEVKPAVPSGIKGYDDLIGGFTPGKVYLFAGDTNMGKSSLVQNIVENNPDKRIAYFSTEMTSKEILGRLLKLRTGITQRMIREKSLEPHEQQLAIETLQELAQRPLYIDHSPGVPLTPERLKARALQIKGAHGLDLLIVDHVTDMGPKAGYEKASLEERQGSVAIELTLLAAALNVPILAAIQLNREVRNLKDARPNRSHLRGSGRWEQLASVITLIYREEVYNPATEFPNSAELIVDKVRDDGKTGVVRVFCDQTRNRFLDAVTNTYNLNTYEPPKPDHDIEF